MTSWNRKGPRRRPIRPGIDALERRELLAAPGDIVPGQVYQDVAFYDANGDIVEVKLNGPTSGNRGFTLRLAGDATRIADIQQLNLVGLTAENGISITVTPIELTISGGVDSKMFSSGYTSIAKITADPGVTAIGGLQLSAAVVDDVALPGIDVGSITLDTGSVAYVDAANTVTADSISISAPTILITNPITGEAEIFDESPTGPQGGYMPALGLIDLWDVEAKSIGAIVVNGAIGQNSGDPFDATNTTNDLRGVIDVEGQIGSIVAPHGAMRSAIRAGGIGSVRLGQIDGEISTDDSSLPMTMYLPKQFTGFIHAAGHLNLGFTDASGELDTGNIQAGGGISGTDPSTTDPVLVPDKFAAPVTNTSTTVGIAGVEVNGAAMARWYSASSIGDVKAQSFAAGSLFEAAGNIGNVEQLMTTKSGTPAGGGQATALPVDLEGMFKAGGNIGNVKSASGIKAELIAGGNIGNITGVSGGLNSTVVQAGGNIGDINVFQKTAATTEILAGGSLGNIHVYSGDVSWNVKATNIGSVVLEAGGMNLAVFVALQDFGAVTITSPLVNAIEGGSLIAGGDMGAVTAYAFGTTAIHGTLIQAGGRIAGVTGISYGSTVLPEVTPGVTSSPANTNNGIDKAQILAAEIGPILGQAAVGTGILKAVIHAQVGDIDSITGIGNGDGINGAIVVAEGGIGPIKALSTVLGDGIRGGSFDANGKTDPDLGNIGAITAQGGPAGGDGIANTRIQASGRIAGIDGTANANGGDALYTVSTTAKSFGPIKALVLGGQTGNGITNMNLRAWSDYENQRPKNPDTQVDSIYVDVRSALGMGITGSIFQIKGDLLDLDSRALNASAISTSNFTSSQGNFGRIHAESTNGGVAISGSLFTASNGSIGSAKTLADAETSGITAIANGTSLLATAISESSFSADSNIGVIKAVARGGTAILNSTFLADSNFGSANNGPNLSGTVPDPDDEGAIFGIYAETQGQNLVSSAGISGSSFEGEKIGFITVNVTDREEGGAGISGSTFVARNAVYDGAGNFDNKGTIGDINVTDGSLRGNGIETSNFYAGAAGSIGNINVTTLGGTGIFESEFRASFFDYDQKHFDGKIGKVTVNAGRAGGTLLPLPPPPNDAWTLLSAGIDSSYFAAVGGIGDVTVNSLGTGVFFSAFLADFDAIGRLASIPDFVLPFFAQDTPGPLGNVSITSQGRFGSGAIFSVFTGSSVGDIAIKVSSRDTQAVSLAPPTSPAPVAEAIQAVSSFVGAPLGSYIGPAASAASLYIATAGNIGAVDVQNAGAGFDSIASAYMALPFGFYGPVTPMDRSLLNIFWAIPRLFSAGSPPAVTADSPLASSYTAGNPLDFAVDFGAPVRVAGQPWFPVSVGSSTKVARYVSGSGTTRLIFRLDADPFAKGNVTVPAGATIQTDLKNRIVDDASGVLVTTTTVPAMTLAATVVTPPAPAPDTVAPSVVSVSPIQTTPIPGSRKPYAVGQVLTVTVTYSEAVRVRGLPTMDLMLGAKKKVMTYAGGDGTNVLVFTYTLTRADLSGAKSARAGGVVTLGSGAAISDSAGNAAKSTTTAVATPATPRGPLGLKGRGRGARR
ncbi:beta strand repeat-containing protein [Singulisphaera sp. PoT]|uniref:beta strand repeat-containing protein n=1 Tax=Singulisphaera sp. PoT TaxID=3411797 RepID=UPI003BF521AF